MIGLYVVIGLAVVFVLGLVVLGVGLGIHYRMWPGCVPEPPYRDEDYDVDLDEIDPGWLCQ